MCVYRPSFQVQKSVLERCESEDVIFSWSIFNLIFWYTWGMCSALCPHSPSYFRRLRKSFMLLNQISCAEGHFYTFTATNNFKLSSQSNRPVFPTYMCWIFTCHTSRSLRLITNQRWYTTQDQPLSATAVKQKQNISIHSLICLLVHLTILSSIFTVLLVLFWPLDLSLLNSPLCSPA